MGKVYSIKLFMELNGYKYQDVAEFETKEGAIEAFNHRLKNLATLFPTIQPYLGNASRLYYVRFSDYSPRRSLDYYIEVEDETED